MENISPSFIRFFPLEKVGQTSSGHNEIEQSHGLSLDSLCECMLHSHAEAFMKRAKLPKVERRTLPPSVRVYFTGRDKPLYDRVKSLADKQGLSASEISTMAIRKGLAEVEKALEPLAKEEVHK